MRIAVIGTGITGNAAAWALTQSTSHEVVVYEKSHRPGGHSATIDIDYKGHAIAVDTGFIVYNELNYPNFTSLLSHLNVKSQASDMSFSLSRGEGAFEWSGRLINRWDGLFAQRRNIVSLAHYRMLGDIVRFNREAVKDLAQGRLGNLTLHDYLTLKRYSQRFQQDYILPMGAAIWSMSIKNMLSFPASSFVQFFANHRLLQLDRPIWRTVTDGSRSYVEKLTQSFKKQIRFGCEAVSVVRVHDQIQVKVQVTDQAGHTDIFDHVILAVHADQALTMLQDATDMERSVLKSVPFTSNRVYLHRDASYMPKRKAAWASWNVKREGQDDELCVTYWMNRLQNIDKKYPLFVTLNPAIPPREDQVFGVYTYDHPAFTQGALIGQKVLEQIQGKNSTHFCGAWTGYGFHEDGLVSGLKAAQFLGVAVPWENTSLFSWASE